MKTLSKLTLLVLLVFAPGLLADEANTNSARSPQMNKQPAAGNQQTVTLEATDLKWGPTPPSLPKGAQIAVLNGDPDKPAPFIVRFKFPDGYKIPPHWHTRDENLTILSGTFVLHMGDTMQAPAHELTAGGYHFLPGKAHHAAEAKGETIVQLHGMGPFDIHYLNPSDDPRKTASR